MADEVLLTCHTIDFEDGYPVLRKVFRHSAKTPNQYVVWFDAAGVGSAHVLVQYSNGITDHIGDWPLRGAGQDYLVLSPPPDFEGGVEIAIIDAETGNARALRSVHFGGLQ
jgi:hypothetical protein